MTASRGASAAISIACIVCLSSASPALAGKPPPLPPPPASGPDLGLRLPNGNGTKLVFANENGSSQMTIYTTSTSFRFDLAPRGQKQVAIVDAASNSSVLKLLTYTINGSGVYMQSNLQTLAPSRSGSNVDFSPDGTRIAYVCCSNGSTEKLVVYDLTDGSITEWATAEYFWDFAWYKGGSSIAYSTLLPVALYELTGPGASPQLLYTGQGELNVDSSRIDADTLVLSYNDTSGAARIGLWKNGSVTNPDVANSARSWWGTLNCDDTKLAYGGVQNNSGSQAFYVRDRNTGITTLTSKNSGVMPQFWPTCS
jgi:hypothetical protein